MPRTVLITGGSGYFGTILAQQALTRGDTVRILDLNTPNPTLTNTHYIAADIRDRPGTD
jgi:nucleoside-diphosphate-sugar epimerase